MPPRPGIEPDDLVSPSQAADLLGVPVNRLRVWIHRHQPKAGRQRCRTCDTEVVPLGRIGRWHRYDYRDLARIEKAHRQGEANGQAA